MTLSTSRSRDWSGGSSNDVGLLDNNPSTSLSKLFSDAEDYKKALAECRCHDGRLSTKEDCACVTSFKDLIGDDLNIPENAATSNMAKMAKMSVTGDGWTPGHALTSEPESYDDDDDSPVSPEDPETKTTKQEVEFKPVVARSSTIDGERWKLEPRDIVDLLIQEFGSLASEDEEEKLIIEADAGLFNDIIILVCTHYSFSLSVLIR